MTAIAPAAAIAQVAQVAQVAPAALIAARQRAGRLPMLVSAIDYSGADADVRTVSLVAEDGGLLAPFVPGSHLVVDCGGRSNAYSLLDDGVAAERYRICVLLSRDGEGGSRWIHQSLRVGDRLEVSRPRSAFRPVAAARHHLLIAAGIGVTPILSHARAARRWGRSFCVMYRYRPGRAAHLEEVRGICGAALEEITDRPSFSRRLAELLTVQPLGSHLYVCGPGDFTADVSTAAAGAGWPSARLHSERFSAADLEPGRPFSARLRDGTEVDVASGVSLLEALEERGVTVANRCRQGICGECRLGVIRGVPEHRDLYLSESERAANDSLISCVSRAFDPLELAL